MFTTHESGIFFQINRRIYMNKQDITLRDFRQMPYRLIDMILPIDINVSVQTYQELSKYKYFEIESVKYITSRLK